MAERGVYTKAEKAMLDADNKNAEALVGWADFFNRFATEESIKQFAFMADQWNPFWNDDDYAARTRWGGLIAYPTYLEDFRYTPMLPSFDSPPEMGFQHFWWVGENWEFFKPVHPGDTFKLWQKRPYTKDLTPLDGKGPRTFVRLLQDHDHINQRDELVSNLKLYEQRSFIPEPPKPHYMPDYGYTAEEIEFIKRAISEEELRGANIRYWEDVKVGEEAKPTVLGPTNIQTSFEVYGSMGTITKEAILKFKPGQPLTDGSRLEAPKKYQQKGFLKDAVALTQGEQIFVKGLDTGLLYPHASQHFSDRAAQAIGDQLAYIAGYSSMFNMLRVVTNWMGDDGFVRKFNWRHPHRVPIGDTLIGRGKVTNKSVQNGEHLVDFVMWERDMRGRVTGTATATVSLLSKDDPYPTIK